jgi:hypothetical protein
MNKKICGKNAYFCYVCYKMCNILIWNFTSFELTILDSGCNYNQINMIFLCVTWNPHLALSWSNCFICSTYSLGFTFLVWTGIFLFPPHPHQTWAYSAYYPNHTMGSFFGVKQPEHGANHSTPFSTNVMNEWSYTITPLYIFMDW